MSRSNGCREWLWAALLVAFAAGAAGCHSEGEAPEGAAEQTVATVVTAPVARGPVQQTVETYGVVEFDPHRARSVAFVKAGQVLQVLVTPGQQVRQGEPLVTLGPIPGGSLEVEKARIDLEFTQRNLERTRGLRETQLATNEQVQQAEKDVATARAVLEGLGVRSDQKREELQSPFAGVVVKALVTSGAIVHPDEDAFLLAPERGVVVRAGFEQHDVVDLAPGMEVLLQPVFPAGASAPARATLAQVHPVVDPESQLVEALIQPAAAAPWMAAGAEVRVRVVVHSAPQLIRVPREALLTREGAVGVFTVADGRAHWSPIEVGLEGEAYVEARRGVQEGDQVATTGRSSLADGMLVHVADNQPR